MPRPHRNRTPDEAVDTLLAKSGEKSATGTRVSTEVSDARSLEMGTNYVGKAGVAERGLTCSYLMRRNPPRENSGAFRDLGLL